MQIKLAGTHKLHNFLNMHASTTSPAMPTKPSPPTDHRPARREVHLRTKDITEDDLTLLADLDAVAQLQRTTRTEVIANLVKRTLPPQFATQVAAA
jgi:hypothetical protein